MPSHVMGMRVSVTHRTSRPSFGRRSMPCVADVNEAYGRYFSKSLPARATVQVAALPRRRGSRLIAWRRSDIESAGA